MVHYRQIKAFSLIEISLVIVIVGILITGIVKGVDLVNDAKLSSANNLSKKSRLARTKDLTLWLDTTDPSKIECHESKTCSDGHKVKIWYDVNTGGLTKINVGRNSGGNNAPAYVNNAINNLPAIQFNQDYNQYLSNIQVPNPALPPITKDNRFYTMITVWKPIKRDVYANSMWNQSIISQGSAYSMSSQYHNITAGLAYYPESWIGFWGYWNGWNTSFQAKDTAYATIMVVNNNTITFYHNSLTPVTGGFGGTSVGTCEFTVGIWACRKPYGLTSYHGLISELAVIDRAIMLDEAQDIMKYLVQKWGIVI